MRISDFQAMTFDCYGTLIDWETGIADHLGLWAERHGVSASRDTLLDAYASAEARAEAEMSTAPYRDILRAVFSAVASRFDVPAHPPEAEAFADSVGDWPVFTDTPAALRALKKRYRLLVVSNVDRYSFARTQAKLGIELDGLVIAEDVGAYKPDPRMFERTLELLADMGIDRAHTLHVAQSLFHDHLPAKKIGLKTVWVNRRKSLEGWGATPPPDTEVSPDIVVSSLAELVQLDDEQRGSAPA